MGLFSASTVLISMQRAILVKTGQTSPITNATIIEVLTIISVLYIGIVHLSAIGVTAAAAAFLSGRLVANTYLYLKIK